MLWTPQNSFRSTESNSGAPSGSMGTSVTPGNNTMGSWTQLMAATAYDNYLVFVSIGSNTVSGAARDTLVDIGIGAAASETVWIPYLLASNGHTMEFSGHTYLFPLYLPSGTRVAARASVNNATVGTLRVYIKFWGSPSRPELVKAGAFARSFGEVTASSRGTLITPGTSAAEGGYTQVGSATADDLWWWQMSMGINDASMVATTYMMDLAVGDATNKHLVIENMVHGTGSNETQFMGAGMVERCVSSAYDVPSGQNVYVRASMSGATADTDTSAMAWGVGG